MAKTYYAISKDPSSPAAIEGTKNMVDAWLSVDPSMRLATKEEYAEELKRCDRADAEVVRRERGE